MNISVTKLDLPNGKFFVIQSDTPSWGKTLVNKPDGSPYGGLTKVWNKDRKENEPKVVAHMAANQFLANMLGNGLEERDGKPYNVHGLDYAQGIGAYTVRNDEASQPVVAATVKYLRDHAVQPDKKPPKDASGPIDALLAQQKADAKAELAAILGL